MGQWEYKIIRAGGNKRLEAELNELGQEGWEVVGFGRAWGGFGTSEEVVLLKRRSESKSQR